ncbi:MAG TPA: NAD(P)-dependent oxidoreductase [Steroidobacteraceae bacterium]|nr:NAD(P)-dependent oxidoreductase [Steroidobacteraceae bacterium]
MSQESARDARPPRSIGFIGLGNLGSKLAATLLRNGSELIVHDLDERAAGPLLERGAHWAATPRELAQRADIVITCLPSPAVSAHVLQQREGVLEGLWANKLWLEMSTTEAGEVRRLGELVLRTGAWPLEAPVSGGCHRAASGNISIFVGGERAVFEQALPLLRLMGRRIIHVGPLGSASVLKVVTNYLAFANLAALTEAWTVALKAGMDPKTTYEAIKASSGNSFVHETESQVILNGSYDINFTVDLVLKDIGLFLEVAHAHGVPTELADTVTAMFRDTHARYGPRALSPRIIQRLEDDCGIQVRAPGFPSQLIDREPEQIGEEILPSETRYVFAPDDA